MAEELIIRVKVDGMGESTSKRSGGNGAGTGSVENLATGALIASRISRFQLNPRTATGQSAGGAIPYKESGWYSKAEYEQQGLSAKFGDWGGKLAAWGTRRTIGGVGLLGTGNFFQEQETWLGEQERLNGKKYMALGAVTAYKAISSATSIMTHQSGDSYANQVISNNMKYAGYTMAVAASGPAAGFVIAGIAINEVANAIAYSINYRFDRALEGDQIRNMTVIAGDVAYGRKRGGG